MKIIVPEKSALFISKRTKSKPSNPENSCNYTSSSTVSTRYPETVVILFSYFTTSENEMASLAIYLQERQKVKETQQFLPQIY